MKITIDSHLLVGNFQGGAQLSGWRGGLLVYTERLVEHLARIDHDNRYELLFSALRLRPEQVPLDIGHNFRKVVIPFPDRRFRGRDMAWFEAVLPAYLTLSRADVYHLPTSHHLPRLGRFKKVYTVHDMRTLHIQDGDPQDLSAICRSCQRADRVIAVSEFTRDDILRHCRVPERKVEVIPLGVDSEYRPHQDPAAAEALAARLGLRRPFFLSLGLVPRKNISRLLEAWARFRHRDQFQLVLAGHHAGSYVDRYKAQIEALGLERSVALPGSIAIEDLPLLYNAAHCFVFPSLLEGFGLPALEAMACGTPVITSNLSALPEVVGDAAVQVDPYDPGDIAAAMERLAEDGALCQALSERGVVRAGEFSWQRMARRIRGLYESV